MESSGYGSGCSQVVLRIYGYTQAMVKILVSIEDKLLKRIDGAARRLGFSRSAYLSHIATLDVERYDGPGKDRQVKGALRSIDELFAAAGRNGDSTRAIREERDRR